MLKIRPNLVLISSMFLLIIISGCTFTNTDFEFEDVQCYTDIDPYSEPKSGILDHWWVNDSVLVVEGYVKTYCGGAEIIGDYDIEGEDLNLTYKIKTGFSSVTGCLCTHKVVYKISNLEMQNYTISIMQK